MNVKENNEITLKIKCTIDELYKILENRGYKAKEEFTMDDVFMIPDTLNIDNIGAREILSKAVLVRDIERKGNVLIKKKLTFKIKKFDEEGNILSQSHVSCSVEDIEEAQKFMEAIGYKKIMEIKESDIVYEKDGFEIAIKDVENGDKLIEIETVENNENLDTIEKLKNKLEEEEIPVYTDSYFVKKAEIELNKILRR